MNVTRETVRLYWRHAWRYPRYVVGILLSVPLTVLTSQYLPPLILANVLNRLSKHDFQPHHAWASFGGDIGLYAIFIILGGLLWRVVDYFDWELEGKVERDLAQRVFRHLMSQSADFHANHFGGSLVSQNNKLLGGYIRMADTTVFQVLPMLASMLWATVILAGRAPLFTALLLSFSVLYIVSSFFVTRRVRRLGAAHAEAESEQTGKLADNITNVMAVKSFAGSEYERRQFARTTETTRARLMTFGHASQQQQLFFGTFINVISAMSLLMAVIGVMTFGANLATVFLILSYTSSIVSQLFSFSNNSLRNYNRSFGDAADMVEILQLTPEVQDPVSPEKSRIRKGVIEFKDVTFTHNGADDALFDRLNLEIKSGEKVGLVGHSGSGKTTFTRLLLRFSDIDGGEVLIDGQNIAHIAQDDLRSQIAYVPQEPLLFHRTIRENIAYGRTGASEKDVLEAARKANADGFIKQLPHGYDTLVGERGVKLSGGQRQRIAIARAILKDAPILLLDEATSSLDSESEALIQDALRKLMQGRTAIIIAHRLSTIQKMDRIVVLDNGKIAEQGSHAELLKSKGTYAKLWQHQSGGFIEE